VSLGYSYSVHDDGVCSCSVFGDWMFTAREARSGLGAECRLLGRVRFWGGQGGSEHDGRIH
jgi:hypothetical protein